VSTHAERSETTRAKLLDAGRRLFGRDGFSDTSLDDVVRFAGVTRGALYHHFDSKEGLFLAVFEEVERELAAEVRAGVRAGSEPRTRLRDGLRAFLAACQRAEVQQITLDAPAVLGWQAWRDIDSCHIAGLLREGLAAAMTDEQRARRPVDVVTQILRGALAEAAQLVAGSEDRPEKLEVVMDAVEDMVHAMLTQPALQPA